MCSVHTLTEQLKVSICSPEDMKKGILNLPERTRSRNAWRLQASKGSAPHTITYRTTPML